MPKTANLIEQKTTKNVSKSWAFYKKLNKSRELKKKLVVSPFLKPLLSYRNDQIVSTKKNTEKMNEHELIMLQFYRPPPPENSDRTAHFQNMTKIQTTKKCKKK